MAQTLEFRHISMICHLFRLCLLLPSFENAGNQMVSPAGLPGQPGKAINALLAILAIAYSKKRLAHMKNIPQRKERKLEYRTKDGCFPVRLPCRPEFRPILCSLFEHELLMTQETWLY
jgi:hypothetical protein